MDQTFVLRGNLPATIDAKGRLKVPTGFFAIIAQEYGRDLFLTSVLGDCVRVYPLRVWAEVEEKLAKISTQHPARVKFLERVNFYGQVATLDSQGRVVIPPRLREAAHMTGEVDVLGQYDHLEVWNHERLVAKLQRETFTDDEARALADLGI